MTKKKRHRWRSTKNTWKNLEVRAQKINASRLFEGAMVDLKVQAKWPEPTKIKNLQYLSVII